MRTGDLEVKNNIGEGSNETEEKGKGKGKLELIECSSKEGLFSVKIKK